MIIVRNTPFVGPQKSVVIALEGWEILFIVGDAFDYEIPFRAMLQEITEQLSTSGDSALRLPPYEKFEDFVKGEIVWGADIIGVYYEHSLGYFDLSSADRSVLDRLLDCISGIIEVSTDWPATNVRPE